MPCSECRPDTYDYGYDLPDTRISYKETKECECIALDPYCDGCEDCDFTGYTVNSTIKVCIERTYVDCECGYGLDYTCRFRVKKDNKDQNVWFSSEAKAERWIQIEFPEAKLPEPDYAWESERMLRIAEGWGCQLPTHFT